MRHRRLPLPILSTLSTAVFLQLATAQTPPQAPTAAPDQPKPTPAAVAQPQQVAAAKKTPKKEEQLQSFKFEGADLDTVMAMYCSWTDKIYLKTDAVKATITLKADKLTTSESIKVVEAILAMNNIALVPMGDRYIKVVQATAGDLTGHGLQINIDQEHEYAGSEKFVTQIIQLKNVEIPEVQAAVQHLLHAYGKILALQRSNSLMITDTEANIIRVRELIEFIDQASASIEPRIYQIQYAVASEIAAKLNEIITAAQGDKKKTSVTPVGNPSARTPPGVIRARTSGAKPAAPTKATISQTEEGSTVIIQGTVKVMSDERTNIIIIFSQEENFVFFDKIIEVLDVEVEPATSFEVVNLEYADAEELSGTLNELVGAAQSSKSTTSGSSQNSQQRGSRALSGGAPNTTRQVTPNAAAATVGAISSLSKLSENTKILADKRTNSILLMGKKSDISAIKDVIASLDVMLEQVIIEAAIFEIGLDADLQHGVDWVYQSQDGNNIGAWDGKNLLTNSLNNVVSGAFSYYLNATGIDSKFLVNLSKTDTDARLVSTPVIMTTDNTEASLSIGEQRPVVTSTDSFANSSGTQRSNYEYKDIGIQLTVTPRINPQRVVIMELTQKADSLGGNIDIDGNQVPIIKNREFEASVAVPDGGTVVLGGLISTEVSDTMNKIPILGDIPLLGRYLFSSVHKVEAQRELIVLLTPYVMSTQDEVLEQTDRLYQGTDLKQEDWKGSWSESKLRLIPDPIEPGSENAYEFEPKPQSETTEAPKPSPTGAEVEELLNSINQ